MADNMNVSFLQGKQSSLDELILGQKTNKNIKQGAFYLTDDTFRLYYGAAEDNLVALNEGVITVQSTSDLPAVSKANAGNFYYITDDNILCVSNGKDHWVQINPDTDTNTSVHAISVGAAKKVGDDWEYTLTLTQQDKDGTPLTGAGATRTATFKITPAMVTDLAVDVKVGLDTSVEVVDQVNIATIKTAGVGIDGDQVVTIKGGANVDISAGDDTDLVITAIDTTYDLDVVKPTDSDDLELQLKDAEGSATDTKIAFKAGTGLEVSLDGKGVKYTHKDSTVTAATYGKNTVASDTNMNVQTITMPIVTVDAQGHITAAEEKELSIVNDTYTANAAALGTEAGTIVTGIKDKDGTAINATSGKILYHKITVDGSEVTKYNTESLGSFYSKGTLDTKFEDIEDQFKTIDAMVYMGVVDAENGLPTSDVKNGHTYKVAEAGIYADVAAKAGDIFIARGTENEEGVLETPTWDKIESGDIDTQYTLKALNNEIILTDSVDKIPQKIKIEGGAELTATTSDDGKTITIDHDVKVTGGTFGTNADGVGYSDNIVIPEFTVNEYGHITAIENKNVQLPAEKFYDFAIDNNTLSLTEDGTKTGNIKFTDDNWIDATLTAGTGNDKNKSTLAITHNNVTRTNTTGTALDPGYGGKFNVITGVTSDAKGHVTGVQTSEVLIPASDNTTYTLSGATVETLGVGTTSVKFTHTLTDNDKVKTTSVSGLYSDSLKFTLDTANNAAKVELVWGSF